MTNKLMDEIQGQCESLINGQKVPQKLLLNIHTKRRLIDEINSKTQLGGTLQVLDIDTYQTPYFILKVIVQENMETGTLLVADN